MSAAEQAAHKVRMALRVEVSTDTCYIVQCECGWESPLCLTSGRANDLYAEHKAKRGA